MSCIPRERLWAWVHEGDEDSSAAEIAAHVSTCQSCSDSVAEMRGLVDDLRDAPATSATPAPLPESIADYRILRKLGEGGMGVIFEAEQQSPRRRVALKLVRGSQWGDAYRVRLFRREMQTLARLNHPAIAAIYDAGCTESGQYYYAMELVPGVPLVDFANGTPQRPALSFEQRLRLFLRVCEAISYAHQRGVVHRDLKPSNILVTDDGQPKVLDFGLARLDEGEPALVSAPTESGRLIGTLAYMSPEQARAETDAIDVRTDVYALGIILYELLTGALPNDVLRQPIHVAVKNICEQAPPHPRTLNSSTPLDAATIALKALEKEPPRRYQTAADLAGDVQRYLTNRPILARPASPAYRARKFVERHTLPVALATLVFLSLVGGVITFAVMAARLERERDFARGEADKFASINAVLTNFLTSSNPWQQGSMDTRVVEVLDSIVQRIETEVGDKPLVAAALRNTLGNTYRAFSRYEDAERHLRYAYDVRRERLGDAHADTVAALSDMGELLFEAGRVEDAAPILTRALEQRRSSLPADHPDLGWSMNSVGLVLKTQGRLDEAESHFRAAHEIREALVLKLQGDPAAPRPERAAAAAALAQTLNNLAALLRARAAAEPTRSKALLLEARANYERALELRRQWLGDDHPDVAKMHNNYAKLLIDLNEPANAERHLREALRILRGGLGDEHRFTARASYNLAELLALQQRWAEAALLVQQALEIQTRLLPADDPHLCESQALSVRLAGNAP